METGEPALRAEVESVSTRQWDSIPVASTDKLLRSALRRNRLLVVILDEVHHQEIPPGSWSVEPCSVDTDGCVSLVGAGLSPPVLTYYRHQINFADIPGLDRGQSLTVWYTHSEQFGIIRRYGTVQGASQVGFVVVDPVHTHLSRHRLAGLLTACALLLALLGVPLLVWRPVFNDRKSYSRG